MRRDPDTSQYVFATQLFVVCAVGVLIVALVMHFRAPFNGAEGWRKPFVKPILALELPASTAELQELLAGAGDQARRNTRADLWLIAGYGLLFLSLAYVHKTQRAPYRNILWFSTIVLAIVTVVFDLLENWLILRNIKLIQMNTHAEAIVPISAVKWGAFFAVMLLAAPIFMRRVEWPFAIGAALTFFSSVGLIGCLGLAFTMSSRAVITVALFGVLLAMFAGVVLLGSRPCRLLPPMASVEAFAAAPGYIASPAGRDRRATSRSRAS